MSSKDALIEQVCKSPSGITGQLNDWAGMVMASWSIMDDSTLMIQLFHYRIKTWIAQIDAVAAGGDCIAHQYGVQREPFYRRSGLLLVSATKFPIRFGRKRLRISHVSCRLEKKKPNDDSSAQSSDAWCR
jgi:hypothetical protein